MTSAKEDMDTYIQKTLFMQLLTVLFGVMHVLYGSYKHRIMLN